MWSGSGEAQNKALFDDLRAGTLTEAEHRTVNQVRDLYRQNCPWIARPAANACPAGAKIPDVFRQPERARKEYAGWSREGTTPRRACNAGPANWPDAQFPADNTRARGPVPTSTVRVVLPSWNRTRAEEPRLVTVKVTTSELISE